MKKTVFLALVFAFALGACGGKKKPATTGPGSADGSAHHDGSAAPHTDGSAAPTEGGGDGSAAPTP